MNARRLVWRFVPCVGATLVGLLASCGGSDGTSLIIPSDGGPAADAVGPTDTGPNDGAKLGDSSGHPGDGGDAGGDAGCGNVTQDPKNCGTCGHVCGAGQSCSNGACACPIYQSFCNGACIGTSVDPNNCGGCNVTCTGTKACSSGVCSDTCLPGLTKCGNACVDLGTDNAHCGSCAGQCGTGMGCVSGVCVPAVSLGPNPPKCVNGGPPISVNGGCTGNLAQTTFTWALCSCKDITLGGRLLTDAYDSSQGPYAPGGLGGGVGLNGSFGASSIDDIGGTLWASAAGGVSTSSTNTVREELHVGGPLATSGNFSVAYDAWVDGNVSTSSSIAITKDLYQSPGNTVTGAVTYANHFTSQVVNVPPPCDCAAPQIIPVAAIVAAERAPNNDNALIGLDANVVAAPLGNPVRIDLPCGYYYLSKINNGPDPVTIVAHGHTALFIDGDVTAAPMTFALDPTATFDIFMTGVLAPWSGADINIGSPNYPALTRVYSGGTANTSLTGGSIGGELYAATSPMIANSTLTVYGALYAGDFSNTSETAIHYDLATLNAGATCPPPPVIVPDAGAPDGGGPPPACNTCKDCGNQACVNGSCGSCTTSAQCCAPLMCYGGKCVPVVK